jgi:lipopolysaccharide transport system ATP-binding protein
MTLNPTVAIDVHDLGKRYRLGEAQQQYGRLSESLAALVRQPLRAFGRGRRGEEFWALHDVDFDVARGEVLGIIGRNGAGKSTLLKILSRITPPSTGTAELRGRVGSLLEVGTGFHPELTGRDNVFLNGALLGMRRREIGQKFDDIVGFAEVSRFIDTPVKRYSSGMYVRLAFAVAAHLEPEILIVDEVLAVGDAAFQRKCLDKMGDVANEGRTVLFVSHNMAAVKNLCHRAILLDGGTKIAEGSADTVAAQYLGAIERGAADNEVSEQEHLHGGPVYLRRVRLLNAGSAGFAVAWRQQLELELELDVREPLDRAVLGAGVVAIDGTPVFTVHHTDAGEGPWQLEPGLQRIRLVVENPLRAGLYRLVLGAHDALARTIIFHVPDAATFEVLDVALDEERYIAHNQGIVNGYASWSLETAVAGSIE